MPGGIIVRLLTISNKMAFQNFCQVVDRRVIYTVEGELIVLRLGELIVFRFTPTSLSTCRESFNLISSVLKICGTLVPEAF